MGGRWLGGEREGLTHLIARLCSSSHLLQILGVNPVNALCNWPVEEGKPTRNRTNGFALVAGTMCQLAHQPQPLFTFKGIDMKNALILATVIASAALVACGKKEEAPVAPAAPAVEAPAPAAEAPAAPAVEQAAEAANQAADQAAAAAENAADKVEQAADAAKTEVEQAADAAKAEADKAVDAAKAEADKAAEAAKSAIESAK